MSLGVYDGVDTSTTFDSAPAPRLVTAETRKLYDVARFRPVTLNDVEVDAVCGIDDQALPLLETSTV